MTPDDLLNDSKWEIVSASPAKKQRYEGYASSPPPLPCSSAKEEKEDPRSEIVFYNYDDDSDFCFVMPLIKPLSLFIYIYIYIGKYMCAG
ncbi:hypothetical protein CsSME_00042797 [Camellia sinensis var. sinensis]